MKRKQDIYIDLDHIISVTKTKTFTADIYFSVCEGYTSKRPVFAYERLSKIIQGFCKEYKVCVTTSPTSFTHVEGEEEGFKIGFINYPRFPKSNDEIRNQALHLAEILKHEFKQYRVSVVCSDYTYMIGEE